MSNHVTISIPSFLDYMHSTPRTCMNIIKRQRAMYLDPSTGGWHFYGPFLAGMRRAANSTDPDQVVEAVVQRSRAAQQQHYRQLAEGFRHWWPTIQATGVRAPDGVWTNGELTVKVRQLLGLRRPAGSTEIVLPYLKEPELSRDTAELGLRILERMAETAASGVIPVVLDVRRGKTFRLRRNTNRSDLDALLAGEAAKYVTLWRTAA